MGIPIVEKSTYSTLTGEKVKTKKKHEVIIIHVIIAKAAPDIADVGSRDGKRNNRLSM